MAEPYIWGALARATNDSTTIDEAIGEAIDAHLSDPDAHLDETGSLQSHRAAEIIDHLAESVVNDKIAPIARTYTAIVDPASDVDFDTIQAALDYTVGKGGGTIFVRAGTHYISGVVFWPNIVNMVGEDVNSTIVVTDYDNGKYFDRQSNLTEPDGDFYFEGITFQALSQNVFYAYWEDGHGIGRLRFTDCRFIGAGGYYVCAGQSVHFTDCYFELSANSALKSRENFFLENCTFMAESATGVKKLFGDYGEGITSNISMISCRTSTDNSREINYFSEATYDYVTAIGCVLHFWTDAIQYPIYSTFLSCYISNYSNGDIAFEANNTCFYGCTFSMSGGSSNIVLADGVSGGIVMGCNSNRPFVNTMGEAIIRNNGPESDFWVYGTSDTAMNLQYIRFGQLTPNSTRTLTTTVPRAGERRSIMILTSGSSSYTLTFGTGFKTVGTLATGSTSARRFVIEFVSDGTYLVESSRTTAIA